MTQDKLSPKYSGRFICRLIWWHHHRLGHFVFGQTQCVSGRHGRVDAVDTKKIPNQRRQKPNGLGCGDFCAGFNVPRCQHRRPLRRERNCDECHADYLAQTRSLYGRQINSAKLNWYKAKTLNSLRLFVYPAW